MNTPGKVSLRSRVVTVENATKALLGAQNAFFDAGYTLEIQNALAYRRWIKSAWTPPVLTTLDTFWPSTIWASLWGNLSDSEESRWLVYFSNDLSIAAGTLIHFSLPIEFNSRIQPLGQFKKRQWGLFVKTRNRKPRHRGPKTDRLYIRVPHR
jgi:hypothetical protein